MVNSTLAVDKFNQSNNKYTCALQNDEGSAESEFAIPVRKWLIILFHYDSRIFEGTMNWSASEQSLLLSARFYGSCLSVAFSGAVADAFGADRVLSSLSMPPVFIIFLLSVVLALSAVITLLTPLFSSLHYHIVLASRFVLGFIDVSSNSTTLCSNLFRVSTSLLSIASLPFGFQQRRKPLQRLFILLDIRW